MAARLLKARLPRVLGLLAFPLALAAPVWAQPCITPGIPCPATSVIPGCIMLLPGFADGYTVAGYGPAVDTPYQPFTIVINDGGSAPVGGVAVVLDFTGAADMAISDAQTPGVFPACGPPNTITVVTGAAGGATFVVRGAGRHSVQCSAVPGGFGTVSVTAGGVFMGMINATVPDQNGAGLSGTVANGLDPADLAFARDDLFNCSGFAGRTDFNCDGVVGAVDLIIMRMFLFYDVASMAPQATAYCP